LLPIADGLAEAGADVVLAVRDLPATRRSMGSRSFRLIRAPIPAILPALDRPLVSWADLLLNAGYTGTDSLRWLIFAWLDLFRREQTDILLANFAPAALIAGRIAGLRAVCVGSGWTLPPRETPLPSIRPWNEIPGAALREAEARALGVLNAAMVGFGAPPLASLAALFEGTRAHLCCFPETDHYANRPGGVYSGPIYQIGHGVTPEWPAAPGPRVFAYLSSGPIERVIAVLGLLGWPAVVHTREPVREPVPPNVWVSPEPVRLRPVLAEKPIVVCQGLNVVSAALVAGARVLSLPMQQEQLMLGYRLAAQGLGLVVPYPADAGMIAGLLRRLAEDGRIGERTAGFAAFHHGYDPGMAVRAIVRDIMGATSNA
jgi:UDP:flavonoid glycosyltransferase YjiC (YdhE family)